jgi:hypothetical protein
MQEGVWLELLMLLSLCWMVSVFQQQLGHRLGRLHRGSDLYMATTVI